MITCKIKPKVFIDRLLLNNIKNTDCNKIKPKKTINSMSKSNKTSFPVNTLTSKVFEMWKGAISESVIVHDKHTDSHPVFQYKEYKDKESIIIISDNYTNNEINELEKNSHNIL